MFQNLTVENFNHNTGVGQAWTDNGRLVSFNIKNIAQYQYKYVKPGCKLIAGIKEGDAGEPIVTSWWVSGEYEMHALIQDMTEMFKKATGEPICGEIVVLKNGETKRLDHPNSNMIQPCVGRFSINEGCPSLSAGSLDYPISCNTLDFKGEYREANFWVFKNREVKAHNGIDVAIEVRVWYEK